MRTHIHLALALTLSLQPAYAEESGLGGTATTALQGVASTLNTANTLVGSIQSSQTQMQALVNQLSGQMNNMPTSQFDQIKAQLAAAMGEAQLCVQKNTKDYSKYKKAPADPAELNAKIDAIPTCSNYGAIIDSAKKLNDQMKDTNAKMACITNMQNKINEIAEAAKAPFNQMTQSATEVWNTRQKIIDTHKSIADNVDKELNGEHGYKAQLSNLKKLSGQISNALNAGASAGKKGEGASAGINQRIKDLRRMRVNAANSWYYSLMGDVQSCFANDATRECSMGAAASPANCIRSYIANAGQKGSAAERAQAKANAERLQNTFILNTGDIKLTDTQSNIDVSKPEKFLAHANSRFEQMVGKVVANFKSQNFVGNNVDKGALATFVRAKYNECYQSAVARFNADMASEGSQYKAAVNAVDDQEAALNNEISNLVKDASDAMNDFRTSFNKIYNRDLTQFASDCTTTDSPYASADCLRKIQVTLEGGIKGTRQSVKLDNGTVVNFAPGATVMNLQTMSLNQQGQPTVTTTPTQCVGFDECINVLDRYQAAQLSNVESQKKGQEEFVVTHNKNMDTALTGVSAQFAEISKMITGGVQGINEELAKYGVNASVATKQVEGEKLAKNDKTGLYDMPKSMKAAMAGVGNYTELDNPGAITEAYNTRISTLNEKLKEAAKAKAACAIKKGDLDAILGRIGSCDANICKGDRVARMLRPLETLARKSQVMPSDSSEKNTITTDFERCSRTAKSDARSSDREDFSAQTAIDSITDQTRRDNAQKKYDGLKAQKKKYSAEDAKSCSQQAVGDLEALAANARDSMKGTNDKILAAIRGLSDACSLEPADEEAAIEACEKAKKAVGSASPPSDEAETDVTSTSSSSSTFTNPLSGVKSAK